MIVTKKDVVEMLLKYINRKIDLSILVDLGRRRGKGG